LQRAAFDGGNVFTELMAAAECCSLGQITGALYRVGGEYRRNL
jgi:methylmalonyl-CoA mutase